MSYSYGRVSARQGPSRLWHFVSFVFVVSFSLRGAHTVPDVVPEQRQEDKKGGGFASRPPHIELG